MNEPAHRRGAARQGNQPDVVAEGQLQVYPATPDRWCDVVTVMGQRGDPAYCWCQYFLLRGKAWQAATAEDNKARLRQQIETCEYPPGVLAYLAGEPVGWCAAAPKRNYPRTVASPITGDDVHAIWSITCFVVRVGQRRRGVAGALLTGAIDLARTGGAALAEAYPVDPTARKSVSAAELYHGTLSLFLDAGFEETRRPYPARAVVQLRL